MKSNPVVRRILLRVDGSPTVGMGHVVRCTALADELARHGFEAWFASRKSGPLTKAFEPRLHRLVQVTGPPEAEVATIRAALPDDARQNQRPFAAILLDHYDQGADWLEASRTLGRRRVVIDDLRNRELPCDILVNATPGVRADAYQELVPPAAQLLLGRRYGLLRRAFATGHVDAGTRRHGSIQSVLVSFGWTEHSEMLRTVVAATRSAIPHARIELVLGASETRDLASGPGITVHRDLDAASMAQLMLNADMAVGAGGTMAWERCALALPSVCIRIASNQDAVVDALVAAGAAIDAGPAKDLTVTELAMCVAELARDENQRRLMSDRAWRLVDGLGAVRVAHAIDGVRIRRARLGDARALWLWANDPATRAASFDSRAISFADHREWLKSVLGDPERLLLIGWNGLGLLGQVRFDERGSDTEVSISVAPEHRGTVGRFLLAASIERYRRARPGRAFLARVREENGASRRLFEGAGFSLVSASEGVHRYGLPPTSVGKGGRGAAG